jgi:hypothetical protein
MRLRRAIGPLWPPSSRTTILNVMLPLKARVHNGRLVLDEPTDLPEGAVVELVPVGEGGAEPDDFDDEERRALYQGLDDGIAAARSGDHVDAEGFARELLARK